ncbi:MULTISPECIES: DEAD/DEAH box helicase [Aequorivita]|uniref:DEAD/DEAH box helicase n=1 Tax=Aequorivita iocasae TaxID=2803865 RepID=A0ABX7DSF5_9FLAO|nr:MULTISPECIES: DEAD/DEAH box helicase [Aequorivita]QQX77085.1 DEAD/DEAH box helicase [Aequorivita iocasae]UCA56567.1 DEAD/DEAH box helicase [Aequorivita sp. F7]
MSFKSLGLSDALLKAISKKGYETPSAIQQKAIPLILERKDVLASAQTGSGKTAGFALPLLQILNNQPTLRQRPVRALILTPTRELAAQVQDEFKEYSEFTDLRSTVIFGGVGANPQIKALRNGVDILVATPGRLLDLVDQRALTLSKVEILVLDEADRMLDMGFLRDIKKILALLPNKRQNLLFSATFSKEIKKLANEFLQHPVLVEATPENTTVEKIEQTVYRVDKAQKTDLIIKLISEGNWQQVLVFTRTKHGANRLSEKLEKAKITSAAIHGNKSQGARTRALSGFKEGKVRVLVATDIAARGLDIPLLPHVINFELPNISEDYVHRIGRTGRAGASGEALSLVSLDEVGYLKDIEKLIGERLQPKTLPNFQPTETMADVKAAEEEKKQQKAQRHSRGRNTGTKVNTHAKSTNNSSNRGRGRR